MTESNNSPTESDEEYLDGDASAKMAAPEKAAAVLEAFAETLRAAPEGKRYDIELEVVEHD